MIHKFFFNRLSLENKVKYLHKKGVTLGSRVKNGRHIYIYMVRNLFVEVVYKNDHVSSSPENVKMVHGLDNLNHYLESDFKSRF